MLNEQKLSQYVDQLFLYTTEKTNVKPSCHAKADIGSLIEDETGCPSGADIGQQRPFERNRYLMHRYN